MGAKYTDDYSAKLKIWAREARVQRMPRIAGLPKFGAQKFSSYAAFNAWKRNLLRQVAESGGVQWTK